MRPINRGDKLRQAFASASLFVLFNVLTDLTDNSSKFNDLRVVTKWTDRRKFASPKFFRPIQDWSFFDNN